jgi:hypothetical protein
MEGLSLRDLERIFGMDHRAILRWWLELGLLVGRRWSGRDPHRGWLFDIAEVTSLIREHVYAIHVSRMQPDHKLTRLATFEDRRQCWRSASELAWHLGITSAAVRRAIQRAQIPHRRRHGAGRYGEIRIRADCFELAYERLRAADS